MSRVLESLVTYTHVPSSYSDGSASFFIFKNPSYEEMLDDIAPSARGFITVDGDLYVEGFDKDSEELSESKVIHDMFIRALQEEGIVDLPTWYYSKFHKDLGFDYGISVQRIEKFSAFESGESIDYTQADKENALRIFQKAAKKNPKIKFVYDREEERTV